MEPFSSHTFFLVVLCFIGVVWVVGKKFKAEFVQWLLFLGTIAYTLVTYRSLSKKLFIFLLFYLLIIKLTLVFAKIPKKYFIFTSLVPLFLFKFSDVITVLNPLHNKIAFIGLSYISFRVIQILMDLGGYAPKRFINLVVFLINPFTLLAGPIDRFHRFEQNLEQIRDCLSRENFVTGWYFLLFGLMQKFILAYFWNMYVMNRFSAVSFLVSDIIGIAYSYTVYLYLDFSGYSLMAVGLGYMMGITFPMNFNQPWKTKNPQDLWRRFHITLGSFLNDYFFKPIYMSLMRKKIFKSHRLAAQNISLFLTFLLMGAWNGLKWNYLLSGAMFGLASVVYNTYQAKYKKSQSPLFYPIPVMCYRFFFFNYVVWALYLFSGKMPS